MSLSEHVQCICQLIMAIHGLWWPLMASIFIKNDVLCVKYYYFSIFYSSTWLDLPSGPKEGKVLRWCQGTLYCWHLWPLMASNGLQNWKISCFGNFFANFFCKFLANSTSPMDYTLLQDLKKVYCKGISLEVRWPSNGGHELSLNKPQHDVPFWASHSMYIILVQFIVGICNL